MYKSLKYTTKQPNHVWYEKLKITWIKILEILYQATENAAKICNLLKI